MKPRGMLQLARESRKLFNCRSLRRQWVSKTMWLEQTGKHARFTGGFKLEGAQP